MDMVVSPLGRTSLLPMVSSAILALLAGLGALVARLGVSGGHAPPFARGSTFLLHHQTLALPHIAGGLEVPLIALLHAGGRVLQRLFSSSCRPALPGPAVLRSLSDSADQEWRPLLRPRRWTTPHSQSPGLPATASRRLRWLAKCCLARSRHTLPGPAQ